jgi:hypothetical protein
MPTKYFVALVLVTIALTLGLILSAQNVGASSARCFQADYGADTLVKNGRAIDQLDLYGRHQICPVGNTVQNSPHQHSGNTVQNVLLPTPTETAPAVIPVIPVETLATEPPVELPTEVIPTDAPTELPTEVSPPEPTDCPLNVNRAGHTNNSCDHPDDNSGQKNTTKHP